RTLLASPSCPPAAALRPCGRRSGRADPGPPGQHRLRAASVALGSLEVVQADLPGPYLDGPATVLFRFAATCPVRTSRDRFAPCRAEFRNCEPARTFLAGSLSEEL